MEAEIRKKVETTVIEILKKADLREMTEFKLRAAVSAELGISLSTVDCKMLIRDLVESFLLTDVQETVEDEQVEFPEGARPSIRGNSITKANDALMKKKTPEVR
ncbi:hypothetical protein SAY86_013315 [Trapa natans]|uniref:DEK-C domain-containing protein n=1 Tax=Trapa natans TaxID=22666 RepID=A0AAN7MFM9_TRANT|nr:hypothetical protein SAY86_013315 [Trapa natans]